MPTTWRTSGATPSGSRPNSGSSTRKGHGKKGYLGDGEPDERRNRPDVTRLVDDACIFLNRVGFEGGVGCALHIAALEAGERPMDWKPSVCWQVPIRLEHSTDESGHVTSRLREWKRRDWGEGGDDFGWWCTEEPDAFVGSQPLYVSAKDDIVELVGAAHLRPDGRAAGTPELGAAPPPGGPPPVTYTCAGSVYVSVVGVVVVVEGDAVLLGERGVLVLVVVVM